MRSTRPTRFRTRMTASRSLVFPITERGGISGRLDGAGRVHAGRRRTGGAVARASPTSLDRIVRGTSPGRSARDRFAALFENVPDGVVSVTQLEDGPVVEEVNPAFERIFGYEGMNSSVARSISTSFQPRERLTPTRSIAAEAEARSATPRSNGEPRTGCDFRLRVVPMEMDGSSDRAFGLYTDITAQKRRAKSA